MTYRIQDVARRSGFTATTLRYYEEIGLLPATGRTPAGYRVYDDVALERLAFIARAKQLGCTLDEVADLTTAWDGGECGPVQDRLRTLVTRKMEDAQTRVSELVALTAQLQTALASLGTHRPEGPCDDRCGCVSEPAAGTVRPVSLTAKPTRTAGEVAAPPVACTLGAEAVPERIDDWRRLLAHAAAREPLSDGVRVVLDAEVPLGNLARLVAAEQDCCRFFAFAITIDGRGTALEVRGPADARPVIDAVFGVATAQEVAS